MCNYQPIHWGQHSPRSAVSERESTYARILFIDFSSAFNLLIPQQQEEKLRMLQVDPGTWNWILDLLTQQQQAVRVGSCTGSPLGCVLGPLLFSVLAHGCRVRLSTNHIIMLKTQQWLKLLTDNDESAYRKEVELFTAGCDPHSLILNVDKTKDMVIDFWRARKTSCTNKHPWCWCEAGQQRQVPGSLADHLTFSINTAVVIQRAQKGRGTTEHILPCSFTSWLVGCTAYEQLKLKTR